MDSVLGSLQTLKYMVLGKLTSIVSHLQFPVLTSPNWSPPLPLPVDCRKGPGWHYSPRALRDQSARCQFLGAEKCTTSHDLVGDSHISLYIMSKWCIYIYVIVLYYMCNVYSIILDSKTYRSNFHFLQTKETNHPPNLCSELAEDLTQNSFRNWDLGNKITLVPKAPFSIFNRWQLVHEMLIVRNNACTFDNIKRSNCQKVNKWTAGIANEANENHHFGVASWNLMGSNHHGMNFIMYFFT